MASYVVPKPTEKPLKVYEGGTLTPSKYMPSYYEWLSMQGRPFCISFYDDASGSDATFNLSTILKSETMYITAITLGAAFNVLASTWGIVALKTNKSKEERNLGFKTV
jgi:hypothetical protein